MYLVTQQSIISLQFFKQKIVMFLVDSLMQMEFLKNRIEILKSWKELQNCVLCIVCLRQLFCSVRLYLGPYFLPTLLGNYNQSQKLLRLTTFSWKSPKKMLDLLKNTQDSLSPWLNVVASLKKLCQAVVVKNDQENFQPTLNKRAGGASLTIFVTGCTL